MSDQEGLKQQYFQAVDQDDSLNDDQKQQKKHKIEKDIAAGVITAGLGYAEYKHHEKKKAEEAQGGGGGGGVFGL
ncbi:unnamed protein product [Sphagnum jensenii]|uniref:Uncharacterized protein n=1 Tax=Sphagnum jensenii TaxID=128206 RepID=A0ABP1ALG6_9BRYO